MCKRPYVLPSLVTERGRDERAWPGTVGGTRSTVAEAGQSPSAAGGKLFVCEPHDATGLRRGRQVRYDGRFVQLTAVDKRCCGWSKLGQIGTKWDKSGTF